MIVHKCDFCKKILIGVYTTYMLPVNKYVYVKNQQGMKIARFKKRITYQKIDLCENCSQTLANFYDYYLNN